MTLRDLRRHIGQLVIAGFAGQTVPSDLRALARAFDLGGVIFFARNIAEPAQVAELSRESAGLAVELPLWISVDQEGGRVARLRAPFTEWPPMITLGRSGDERLAERFAKALADELRLVGVNLDFAPVLDVHTNPRNPVIGDRALADRAEVVARLGQIIIRTLQANGVAACGKHFPGHGDTSVDSHLDLPLVDHPPDRLRAVEFVPFKAAIEAGVMSIMTAHLLVPALDEQRPATLSPRIVDAILRKELGFEGLILSDDLEMQAIAQRTPFDRAAVGAIAAGCDCILLCAPDPEKQAQALEALIHAVESGEVPAMRVEDAISRQRRAKERFLAAAPATAAPRALSTVLGNEEHQAIAAEMARYL